jgi:hypothetical protein
LAEKRHKNISAWSQATYGPIGVNNPEKIALYVVKLQAIW